MNWYAYEKVKQLDAELKTNKQQVELPQVRRRPVFGPLAAGAGRRLRRFGEGLESWANVPPREADNRIPRTR